MNLKYYVELFREFSRLHQSIKDKLNINILMDTNIDTDTDVDIV